VSEPRVVEQEHEAPAPASSLCSTAPLISSKIVPALLL
jgi:hypothetical protein